MFIAALFRMATPWKQPRCPTTNKWIKKMWDLYAWKQIQGISLFSYLYLKLVKMPCFSYYFLNFFLLQNWKIKEGRIGSAGRQ
jgi:hypothetical protein